MPTTDVSGIEIYYEVHGAGPPLLNIGGSGQTLADSAPAQSPLNTDFTVCHFDQRGLGRSAIPTTAWSMADHADDAAGLLAELGWSGVPVVGVSFGGMVAQNLVVRHPERVSRLVLACTSSGGEGGSSADLLALEQESDGIGDGWMSLVDTRNDLATGTLAPGMDLIVDYRSRRSARDVDKAARAGFIGQLTAGSGHDVFEALSGVTVPTLVIGGRYDGIAPPRNLEAMAERIPNAELILCDGGHLFMWQDPDAWPAILEFLRCSEVDGSLRA